MKHQKPENINNPGHIPHYEEWPNNHYHADWPHSRHGRWNDSEQACVGDFTHECCNDDYPEDCVCVTSADATRWNALSALTPLIDVDFSDLSAVSALDVDAISAALNVISENADIWSSAYNIPNLYDNLDLVFSALNDKANRSELNKGIYVHSEYFDGNGTENSVLRLSKLAQNAIETVNEATNGFKTPLANVDTCGDLKNDINKINTNNVGMSASLDEAWEQIKLLAKAIHGFSEYFVEATTPNFENTIKESKANPDYFYYYSSTV